MRSCRRDAVRAEPARSCCSWRPVGLGTAFAAAVLHGQSAKNERSVRRTSRLQAEKRGGARERRGARCEEGSARREGRCRSIAGRGGNRTGPTGRREECSPVPPANWAAQALRQKNEAIRQRDIAEKAQAREKSLQTSVAEARNNWPCSSTRRTIQVAHQEWARQQRAGGRGAARGHSAARACGAGSTTTLTASAMMDLLTL